MPYPYWPAYLQSDSSHDGYVEIQSRFYLDLQARQALGHWNGISVMLHRLLDILPLTVF